MKVEVIYMKKSFCLFVVLLILSGLTIAFATGIDFSSYSDAELISIVEQLNAELVARGISKTASITPGSYLVGRDIPAGKYVLKNDTEGTAYYLIYKDDLQYYSDNEALNKGNIYAGKECFITLEEGQALKTRHETLNLTISAGVLFQ